MTCRRPADPRRRLYTLLQIGKREVGMSDDDYRALLTQYGATLVDGRPSAATLNVSQLEQVLEALKRQGFRPKRQRAKENDAWRAPRIAKITALWCQLADAGVVRDRKSVAMERWCASLTGTARLEWATSAGLNRCVEALKSWAARERVELAD